MAEQQKALARSQFKPPAHAAKSSSTTPVQKAHSKYPCKKPFKKPMQKAHAKKP